MFRIALILSFMFASMYALGPQRDTYNNNTQNNQYTGDKKVLGWVLDELQLNWISSSAKERVYQFLDYIVEGQGEWYSYWLGNGSAASSLVKNSSTKVCDITLVNKWKIYNITFVNFSKQRQILVFTKSYDALTESQTIKEYNSKKRDGQMSLLTDTNNFSVFSQNGVVQKYIYSVSGNVGLVGATQMNTINY